MNGKVVNLSDIYITTAFWSTPPKPSKIHACYSYYLKRHRFDRDIVVNENMTLVDGYVAYLVARMMGCATVWVQIRRNNER